MTIKSFIVRYVLFDVDFCEKVDEEISDAFSRNLDTDLDRRDGFDDSIDFEIIFAQNNCFFDVAKSVANKVDSIEVDKAMKRVDDEVSDEVSDEVADGFEGEIDSLGNAGSLGIGCEGFF